MCYLYDKALQKLCHRWKKNDPAATKNYFLWKKWTQYFSTESCDFKKQLFKPHKTHELDIYTYKTLSPFKTRLSWNNTSTKEFSVLLLINNKKIFKTVIISVLKTLLLYIFINFMICIHKLEWFRRFFYFLQNLTFTESTFIFSKSHWTLT